MSRISVIIPVLDEAAQLGERLQALQWLRSRGHELILVDGGSTDGGPEMAQEYVDQLLACQPGRARQMNRGAEAAGGEILLFLHVDTQLPEDADTLVMEALDGGAHCWGRFDVRLGGRSLLLRVVAFMMNWRSRLSGIATGDQALFVRREVFEQEGGYPDIELMEDIALSRRLRRRQWPACLRRRVLCSSRRWERRGPWRTIVTMWALRLAYFLGVSPARLHGIYYGNRREH